MERTLNYVPGSYYAVGNGLVRNKQSSGGRRTGPEYTNVSMLTRLTSLALAREFFKGRF